MGHIRRLDARERIESFLRAQRGEIEIPRGIPGARLRAALIEVGSIVPGGYHEIRDAFETDDRGRFEAACAIFFDPPTPFTGQLSDADRRAFVLDVLDNPHADPGVCGFLRAMLGMPDARRQELRDVYHARRRAWRQLFPHAHEIADGERVSFGGFDGASRGHRPPDPDDRAHRLQPRDLNAPDLEGQYRSRGAR